MVRTRSNKAPTPCGRRTRTVFLSSKNRRSYAALQQHDKRALRQCRVHKKHSRSYFSQTFNRHSNSPRTDAFWINTGKPTLKKDPKTVKRKQVRHFQPQDVVNSKLKNKSRSKKDLSPGHSFQQLSKRCRAQVSRQSLAVESLGNEEKNIFFVDCQGSAPNAGTDHQTASRTLNQTMSSLKQFCGQNHPEISSKPEDDPVEDLSLEESGLVHLQQFYREGVAKEIESQIRMRRKAGFLLNRYYGFNGDSNVGSEPQNQENNLKSLCPKGPDTSNNNNESEKLKRSTSDISLEAFRTNDGYLTKMGVRNFCVVCCSIGHLAHHCTEKRCFICFELGHSVKDCPQAKERCNYCTAKGHSRESCPKEAMSQASGRSSWGNVRCGHCLEVGHLMCGEEAELRFEQSRQREAKAETKAQKVAAVLMGKPPARHAEGRTNSGSTGRAW